MKSQLLVCGAGDDELFRKGNSDIKLPSKALEQKPSAKFL